MPTLVVEHAGARRGGAIHAKVLIGRLPTNGVVLNDSNVSRLHAWIGQADGRYFVRDCGSLSGTFVNGQAVERQCPLADGDILKIGNAQLKFLAADALEPDLEPIDLAGRPPLADIKKAGILFDCVCGAPHWAKAQSAGQTQECDFCGKPYIVPSRSGGVAQHLAKEMPAPQPLPAPDTPAAVEMQPPQAPAKKLFQNLAEAPHVHAGLGIIETVSKLAASETAPHHADIFEPIGTPETAPAVEEMTRTCSICQTAIDVSERMHTCSSCGLTFHEECWIENRGCSAYGCAQVNALAPAADLSQEAPVAVVAEAGSLAAPLPQEDPTGFPWEYAFLGFSVIASLLGVFVFGVPAAIVAIATVIYLVRSKRRARIGVVWAALILSLLGAAAGFLGCNYYHFGFLLGKWAHR